MELQALLILDGNEQEIAMHRGSLGTSSAPITVSRLVPFIDMDTANLGVESESHYANETSLFQHCRLPSLALIFTMGSSAIAYIL